MGINPFTTSCSETGLVDQTIGEAYTTVRHVSENIEYVKHVSANLAEVYRLVGSIDAVDTLVANIAAIDLANANAAAISTVASNIAALLAINADLIPLNDVQAHLPELLDIQANLQTFLDQLETLTAVDGRVATLEANAYDMDHMVEGADTKILTSAERASIASALQSDDIVDEDDMVSDSATKAPSQQSVKAYVGSIFSALWRTTVGLATYAEAWVALKLNGSLSTRTLIKALTPQVGMSVLLTETGRAGQFVWTLGDFSTQIAADTAEGIYLKADSVATTVGAWVRVFGGPLRLEWFGGIANGLTTNTAAFNAAVASMPATGGAIEFGVGTYVFATAPTAVTKPITLKGQGIPETILSISFATGDFITISSGICNIFDLKITASVTRTSGYFIKVDTIRANIHHCYFENPYKAIGLTRNTTLSRISHCEIRNITPHATAFGSGGIDVGDTSTSPDPDSCTISFVNIGNDTSNHHYAGIHIFSATALTIVGCNILQGSFAILGEVATGCGILNLKIDSTYCDSAVVSGLYLTAAGTGNIARVMATGSWFSTANQGSGVTLASIGTGVSSGVSFVNCEMNVNLNNGLAVGDAKWKFVSVIGCRIAQNATGVSVVANANDINIQNNTIGAVDGLTANSTGVLVNAGTSTRILIQNNVFNGNTANITNSATGSLNRIENNEGYNPVGLTAAATMGASPTTITAGPAPETHYVRQSATNTATIAKGGQQVATLAGATTYYTIQLGPNESYVTTWTTTAPTYTKDVH